MLNSSTRECLNCGMVANAASLSVEDLPANLVCPKCDENMLAQTDDSCLTVDIAHQRESLDRAMEKLDEVLLEGWQGYYKTLRLIVGSGLIREEIPKQLYYYQQQQRIMGYNQQEHNRGAIIVTLRHSSS